MLRAALLNLALSLEELSESVAGRAELIEAGGHYVLVSLLPMVSRGLIVGMSEFGPAQRALCNLAKSEQDHRLAPFLVPVLVALLRDYEAGDKLGPLELLAEFGTPAGQDAVREAGAIPLVVELLKAPGLAGPAALVLWALASNHPENGAAIVEAQAIPPLVALLHADDAHDAVIARNYAAGALRNITPEGDAADLIKAEGAIAPLMAMQRNNASDSTTLLAASGTLANMAEFGSDATRSAILYSLAARPPPPAEVAALDETEMLLGFLRPVAEQHMKAAIQQKGTPVIRADNLREAIRHAEVVGVAAANGFLRKTRANLAVMLAAAEAAQRERRASLGLETLEMPDEFLCKITQAQMEDPVVASDGHTYERSAIEQVLRGPQHRRLSPITRETLQSALYPNIALRQRIAAYGAEVETVAERALELGVERAAQQAAREKASPVTAPRRGKRPAHCEPGSASGAARSGRVTRSRR